MTLFFQHPRPQTFVRTANLMTSEVGMGHSGLALGCPGLLWDGRTGVHGGVSVDAGSFSASQRLDR